jgi:hypothetical protein
MADTLRLPDYLIEDFRSIVLRQDHDRLFEELFQRCQEDARNFPKQLRAPLSVLNTAQERRNLFCLAILPAVCAKSDYGFMFTEVR